MFDRLPDRARALLATSTRDLRGKALGGLSVLVLLARRRLAELDRREATRVPKPVQRFGAGLWRRVVERFPALGHLTAAPEDTPHAPAREEVSGAPVSSTVEPAVAAPQEPLSTLLHTLHSPGAEAAAAAALSLADRSEPAARAALLEVVDNVEGYFNPLTRVAALQAIAKTLPPQPSREAMQPILQRVRDLDAEVSMAAIDLVAVRAPADTAIDHLLPVVLDESGYFLAVVRDAATRALERAGLMHTAAG